jgi:hypothetical protein
MQGGWVHAEKISQHIREIRFTPAILECTHSSVLFNAVVQADGTAVGYKRVRQGTEKIICASDACEWCKRKLALLGALMTDSP